MRKIHTNSKTSSFHKTKKANFEIYVDVMHRITVSSLVMLTTQYNASALQDGLRCAFSDLNYLPRYKALHVSYTKLNIRLYSNNGLYRERKFSSYTEYIKVIKIGIYI